MEPTAHIALLEKKLKRERSARKAAEKLLEEKSLDLFNANQLLQQSAEKLKAQAELDSERLAYQTRVETMLLDYGQRFLSEALTPSLLQQLSTDLVDNSSVRAVCIHINPQDSLNFKGEFYSGRRQQWTPPPELQNDPNWWDEKEGIFWLALNSKDGSLGFFAARLKASGYWLSIIRKHIALFGEMLRTTLGRQMTLEQAIQARERAEASERATRDFLAMINHELRTPLNGLLGTAELLEETPLSPEQRKLLTTLNHSGELLRAIINDLLDYSKINAGMLELIPSPFHSKQLAEKLQAVFMHRASEKQLDFTVSNGANIPDYLVGDEDRIKQIFVNLIGNAIKFTEYGSVTAHLDWQDENLVFSVTDSGCGIAKSEQCKLFKPFSQVDISSKRSHEGTGLGLAICRQLALQMNGNILLESDIGKGSTFTVTLPLAVHNHTVEEDAPRASTDKPLDKVTVLVVEDLKTNQMIIKLMLTKMGITPEIADNGKIALDLLSDKDFDLILMDCRMPIMDGYTATRTLREQGYSKPIVALTAGTTTAEREDCITAGMNDILCKPYQSSELRAMIEKWGLI
ncbi:hybrid sensor histidine kinase/response regulator [Photobacterium jeanii]|uniref:histidine kinase n=1 Tax=Photobacterium jeanii TaxID=858640 RepID=A0A178K251_9GAMM|nr:ATP-binding protein [Photobacterium jeanii]OAN11409.1 hybrid sensor histidine kinase/response regulator [Photobacterium jeanii]PST90929.1 hybrid sensor histidine kinase/response regulator [Photobacterium jeanii]